MTIFDQPVGIFCIAFLALCAAVQVGSRLRARLRNAGKDVQQSQVEATRDTLGILVSLLLGFTLAMALPRYDLRKQLVIEEANAIGTASLRGELLPEAARRKVHLLLIEYVDARLAFARSTSHELNMQRSLDKSRQLQGELWQQAGAVAQQTPNPVTALFISSLNQLIDLSEQTLAGVENRVPVSIWIMLGLISLLDCVIVGYAAVGRMFVLAVVSPLMISIVVWLIADLDSPRAGLIHTEVSSLERVQSELQRAAQ